MRRYKVIEVKKQSALKGRLTTEQLEQHLNDAASDGWTFDRAISGETVVMGRDTFMLIFHREAGKADFLPPTPPPVKQQDPPKQSPSQPANAHGGPEGMSPTAAFLLGLAAMIAIFIFLAMLVDDEAQSDDSAKPRSEQSAPAPRSEATRDAAVSQAEPPEPAAAEPRVGARDLTLGAGQAVEDVYQPGTMPRLLTITCPDGTTHDVADPLEAPCVEDCGNGRWQAKGLTEGCTSTSDYLEAAADQAEADYRAQQMPVLKATCKANWPDDFVMRQHCVETETAALDKIIRVNREAMDDALKRRIIGTCVAEWTQGTRGPEFDMALFCIEEQLKAAGELLGE